ncbi:hypothetical protein B0H10DRAFT_2123972, partial [Mycena sp. CBHHK59/15]
MKTYLTKIRASNSRRFRINQWHEKWCHYAVERAWGDPQCLPSDEKEKAPGNEDDYPHGLKLGLLMISLCLSVFLVALIIATTIPKITDQLKSLADVGW